jgi:hypothetical protein
MNPGPATSGGRASPERSTAAATFVASSRGFIPRCFASPIAKFAWKSPNCGFALGLITGSYAAASPPSVAAIAARNRASSRATGSALIASLPVRRR